MTATSRLCRLATLLVLLVLAAGCGIRDEQKAEPVDPTPTADEPVPAAGLSAGETEFRIFLVREQRLAPVVRRGRPSLQDPLSLLAVGPNAQEVSEGFDSALTPQPLTGVLDMRRPGVALIEVTLSFDSLTGRQQLIAVAQLVWTVTDVPGIDRVVMELDGQPVALPTDGGLSAAPVRRTDYASVAPAE